MLRTLEKKDLHPSTYTQRLFEHLNSNNYNKGDYNYYDFQDSWCQRIRLNKKH